MINAIIIDDELHCSETLRIELSMACPDVNIMGIASSGEEGISLIERVNPDLVFLDIEMPRINGFDVLRKLKKFTFDLIFVTAFDQYALKAFRYSAIDYLLKPVDSEELIEAVNKIRSRIGPKLDRGQVDFLLSSLDKKTNKYQKIGLPVSNRIEFVEVKEIVRVEADSNYSSVCMKDGNKLLLTRTLKSLEQLLSEHSFLRIHRSHLINPLHVKAFERTEGGLVHMTDGTQIHLTKYSKKDFLELINLS